MRTSQRFAERADTVAAASAGVLARIGLGTKGIVYSFIGVGAAQTAMWQKGTIVDAVGALQALVAKPLGTLLLSLAVLGLSGYVLWRLVQALFDTERQGTSSAGIFKRLSYAGNGLVYAGLVYVGVELLTGTPVKPGDETVEDWTSRLLAHPLGPPVLILGGILIIGIGLVTGFKGCTGAFRRHLDLHSLDPERQYWLVVVGGCGRIARGVIFGAIGTLLIRATLHRNPDQAAGLRDALVVVAQQPFGRILLGILAGGLVAYGVSLLFESWYYDDSCRA